MNRELEELITRLNDPGFKPFEIVLLSHDSPFTRNDFTRLTQAIERNDWCKDNLEIFHLWPCDFKFAYYFEGFKKIKDFSTVRTGNELKVLIYQIKNNIFHHVRINLYDATHGLSNLQEHPQFNNDDLRDLVNAINASEWCQNHLKEINLAHCYFTRFPALTCRNLLRLNISYNPIKDLGKIECPNLKIFDALNTDVSSFRQLSGCSELETISAASHRIRVPLNVMDFPKLKYYYLSTSSFSVLSKYVTLLLQQHKKLTIDSDREEQQNEELWFRFFNKPANVSVYDFTKEFNMQALCKDHVQVVSKFIKNRYDETMALSGGFLFTPWGIKYNEYQTIKNRLKAAIDQLSYNNADIEAMVAVSKNCMKLDAIFNAVDDLSLAEQNDAQEIDEVFDVIEDPSHGKDVVAEIIENAKQSVAAETNKLDEHTAFFVQELKADFEKIRDVLNLVCKLNDVQKINDYEFEHSDEWFYAFDIKSMLFDEAREYLQERILKEADRRFKLEQDNKAVSTAKLSSRSSSPLVFRRDEEEEEHGSTSACTIPPPPPKVRRECNA